MLNELLAKLEAATEANDDLDEAMAVALLGVTHEPEPSQYWVAADKSERGYWDVMIPRCTRSLDAAIRTALKVFPSPLIGIDNDLSADEVGPIWTAWCYGEDARAATPALAMSRAIVKAALKRSFAKDVRE